MARAIAVRGQSVAVENVAEHQVLATDTRIALPVAFEALLPLEIESSAPMLAHVEPLLPKRVPPRPPPELVALPGRLTTDDSVIPDEAPRYASRNWRAEAWDRERERELRAVERRPAVNSRRRSGS